MGDGGGHDLSLAVEGLNTDGFLNPILNDRSADIPYAIAVAVEEDDAGDDVVRFEGRGLDHDIAAAFGADRDDAKDEEDGQKRHVGEHSGKAVGIHG